MNVFTIISVILFLLYIQLGVYILLKNTGSRINRRFFMLSMCFTIWSLGYLFLYSANEVSEVIFWDQFAMLGYVFFPALMTGFNMEFISLPFSENVKRWIFIGFLIAGGGIYFIGITNPIDEELVYHGMYTWHFVYDSDDIYYNFIYIYVALSIILNSYFFYKWRVAITSEMGLKQFYVIFFPFLFFVSLGIIFDLILPLMGFELIPNIGHISSFPWIMGVAYAIVKYNFMSNPNYLITDAVVKEMREIVIFADKDHNLVNLNTFTAELLGESLNDIKGKSVFDYFENQALLRGYLSSISAKKQIGPVGAVIVDAAGTLIDINVYLVAIKDKFDDLQGTVIYGHDNREALNLQKEIIVRQHAEKNLRSVSEVLETRVKERTAELANSYKELQVKMTERMRVEEHIKADISEKETLINEIHNRVKSNMNIIISLINAQEKRNATPVASLKFRELAQRVKSLLLVHQNLYLSINYSDVDFAGFLNTLATELLVFYKKEEKVELILDVSDVFLDVDYAIPLGVVCNELISNSLYHGFSSYYLKKNEGHKHLIHIGYSYQGGTYEVSISDNGKGLPSDFDIEDLQTNGLPLSQILVNDQINGKMEIHSSKDGTSIKISFLATK